MIGQDYRLKKEVAQLLRLISCSFLLYLIEIFFKRIKYAKHLVICSLIHTNLEDTYITANIQSQMGIKENRL